MARLAAGAEAALREPTLNKSFAFFRRSAYLIVGCLAVGLVAGLGLSSKQEHGYGATTIVYSSSRPVSADVRKPLSLDSDVQLIMAQPTLEAAAAESQYPGGATELGGDVWVTAVPNSRVLRITVTFTDPDQAQRASTALADAFLAQRGRLLADATAGQVAALDQQLAAVETQMTEAAKLTAKGSPNPYRATLRKSYSRILEVRAALATTNVDAGAVIRAAPVPDTPVRDPGLVMTMSLASLGALFGVGLAAIADGRRIRRRAQSRRPEPIPAQR